MTTAKPVKEDVWINTCCNMCFCGCAIRVHRVDGVVVKIEGNPDSPVGEGRVCSKGAAGIAMLYDPNRKSKPMVRTNPKKGVGIDPGWKEISWDEAYDLCAEKIGAVLKKDPKKMLTYSFITSVPGITMVKTLFCNIAGGFNLMSDICGAAIHSIYDCFNATGNAAPDYDYCKYLLQFGTQAGTATRHGFNMTVRRFAEAREKGCKLVSVDPHMSASAEKADRWVPIRPGTDAAMALSIAYVLIHELDVYDAAYLKKFTDSASLVDVRTGRYLREAETQKPLVWDLTAGCAKAFDDPTIGDLALNGEFTINGRQYKTAFTVYCEHIKSYSPEATEKTTTVPAEVVRTIAKELAEAACIGSTITIDGKEMPYRPVAIDSFSGISRHKHAFLSHYAILSLNTILGSQNVPGGLIGFAPANEGYPETHLPSWQPPVWKESNMIGATSLMFPFPDSIYDCVRNKIGWKGRDLPMYGLQPFNKFDSHFIFPVQTHPEVYKQEPAELLFLYAGNLLKNWGNLDDMVTFMESFEYVIGMDHYLNDSSYFYDLYLPEATYLERWEIPPNLSFNHHTIGGLSTPWAYSLRQPVVPARDGAPGSFEFCNEIASRLGLTAGWNNFYNFVLRLDQGEYKLDPDKKYEITDILDRIYKTWFGPSHDLKWFQEHGVITYPRKVEEVYMYPFRDARIPLYLECMLEGKEKVEAVVKEIGIPWETDDWQPLPDWKPCIDHEIPEPGYDLFPVYYTNSSNTDTWQINNPWLNEINENDPYGYNIEINSATAKAKGLRSGDRVILRSSRGQETTGRLIVVEGVHPEVLGVCGGSWGHFLEYLMGKGKGTSANTLVEGIDAKRLCHISAAYDQCVRVKLIKM